MKIYYTTLFLIIVLSGCSGSKDGSDLTQDTTAIDTMAPDGTLTDTTQPSPKTTAGLTRNQEYLKASIFLAMR